MQHANEELFVNSEMRESRSNRGFVLAKLLETAELREISTLTPKTRL